MNRRKFLTSGFAFTVASAGILTADAAQPEYTWIHVKNMHCSACAQRIARKLYTVAGVVKVQTDVSKNFAVITPQSGKQPSPRAIWEAVELAKFTPVKLQGPRGVYTTKPAN